MIEDTESAVDDHVGHPGEDMHGKVATGAVQDTVVAKGLQGMDLEVIEGPGPNHPSTKNEHVSFRVNIEGRT